MSISMSSTRSNGFIKPLRGKENYPTWLIEIETIRLRNNNVAYIRNSSRAVRPRTRYLDDYNLKLKQYNRDLEAYNAAMVAFKAAGRGQALVHLALPKKPNKAKEEEKALKT